MARDWAAPYSTDTAANQHTLSFGASAVAGRRLVAIAAAPATIAFPAGWSELVTSLDAGELSAGILTATGGETGVQLTLGPSGAQRTLVGWVESRDDLGAVNGTPVSAPGNGGSGSVTLSVTTTVPGCRIYAAVMGVVSANLFSPVWPSPLTQETAQYSTGGGLGPVRIAVASGVAASAGTYDITITGLGSDPAQAIAFAVAPASGSEPPTAETVIEAENRLQGVAKSTWDVSGIGSQTIQGYATAMSVNQGGTLSLKVHSPASAWSGKVYRLGYYGGAGAREVGSVSGAQTTQPAGTTDATTGMVSCAGWSVNGSWSVPADATPGVYLVKVARTDNPALASHVGPFVVRNPSRKAPITVKLSDSTWQAYNHAGANPDDVLAGKSIYGVGTAAAWTFDQAQRTRAVSYDRPLVTRHHLPQTTIWNSEYPLIRWLERLGYDVDYVSSLDVDADPTVLLGREVVVSSGHDEYWSPRTHDAFTEARDAGVHLLFLTGNEAFWRINPNALGGREYACWKDTHDGALNASGVYSGTWQDTRSFNPDRRPAALLTGQRFRRNGIAAHALQAAAAHASSPFWRDTAVAALTGSQTWASGDGIVGFEGDEPADTSTTEKPSGLLRLSQASYAVSGLADDDGDDYDLSGTYVHALTVYRAESGAVVFGAGTNQYAWALDDVHDRFGISLVDANLQQALTNLLADLGQVPPEYPFPSGLVLPTPVALSTYGLPDPAEEPPPEEPSGADMLATTADLAAFLQMDPADLNTATAQLLIECATAVVQEAAGQRIVRATSTVTLEPSPGRWLWLPQIPVVSVESVTLDGTALVAGTDYSVRGNRLWRSSGWQTAASWETAGTLAPSEIVVEVTHGYAEGAQELQRARQAVLALAAAVYVNPGGAVRQQVDDYAVAYESIAARMEASPHLRQGLLRYYGRSAGLISIGG